MPAQLRRGAHVICGRFQISAQRRFDDRPQRHFALCHHAYGGLKLSIADLERGLHMGTPRS
jgi:hypothetical protein